MNINYPPRYGNTNRRVSGAEWSKSAILGRMKLALAPMATLTHEPLRRLIHRYGDPDEYFAEMIHAPSYLAGGVFEPWYVRSGPCPERMVWQITGGSVEPIVKTAEGLLALGGIGVDLNMGCSAPDIVRGGAGVAWMEKDPAEAAELVRAVREAIDRASRPARAEDARHPEDSTRAEDARHPEDSTRPEGPRARLGVKLRLGSDDDYDRLLIFCALLAESGADMLTLHPRERREKYSRPARHGYTARLARDLPVPVYANGDVASVADFLALERDVPCAGVMIGRAAVTEPWIFRDIARARAPTAADVGPTAEDVGPKAADAALTAPVDHLEVARAFLGYLVEGQPPEFWLSRARRFFFYYCDNFSFAHHIKMRVQNAKTLDEIEGLLEAYLAEVPGDRHRLRGGRVS